MESSSSDLQTTSAIGVIERVALMAGWRQETPEMTLTGFLRDAKKSITI